MQKKAFQNPTPNHTTKMLAFSSRFASPISPGFAELSSWHSSWYQKCQMWVFYSYSLTSSKTQPYSWPNKSHHIVPS